uniref:NEDD4-binding protein 1 n=1 Tax=Euleptes europaea TaxID=460621 RepID=UPI002541CF7B|nr:NEDD4-binding protein 1 [Euleptes europaea]
MLHLGLPSHAYQEHELVMMTPDSRTGDKETAEGASSLKISDKCRYIGFATREAGSVGGDRARPRPFGAGGGVRPLAVASRGRLMVTSASHSNAGRALPGCCVQGGVSRAVCCAGSRRARGGDGRRRPEELPPVPAASPGAPLMAAFAAAAAPSEGGSAGGARPVVDEFTAPAEKGGFLERSRGGIERLFRVRLAVVGALGGGAWAPLEAGRPRPDDGRRIWLSLLGEAESVRSAKEYIKGLCEPELEEREYYPKDMHCIFVGAQSLFLNCLIQNTCADISVAEIGMLNIKGSAEPVVMARSHIQQFVSLFRNNENLLNSRESEVKKQFKHLVEAHADKYTMDLLILPSSLKRELLNLARTESHKGEEKIIDLTEADGTLELLPNETQKQHAINCDSGTGQEEARNNASTPVTELTKQMDTVFPQSLERHFVPINGLTSLETSVGKERQSCKRRSSESEERLPKKQFSLENNQESKRTTCGMPGGVVVINLVANRSDESEDPNPCPKEGDEISEEIEYKILVNFFKSMGYPQQIVEKVISIHGQLAEPLLLLEEIVKETNKREEKAGQATGSQAVKSKGSPSTKHHLDLGHNSEEPRNAKHDVVSFPEAQYKTKGKLHLPNSENKTALACDKIPPYKDNCSHTHLNYCSEQSRVPPKSVVESDGHVSARDKSQELAQERKPKNTSLVARGTTETSRQAVQKETVVAQTCADQSAVKHDQKDWCNPLQHRAVQLPSQKANLPDPPASYLESRPGVSYSHHNDPSVTGVQRFLESLKIPYKLELKNEPGRAHLKHIIIDGSNVAISHGLNKFFSCRGIAIAVEYFWKRGHRRITVFVPQWRTRRDPSITEQHFLSQLQDVGILALTPARVVLGARIASHDDRFLLHLAERTDGVIVTNDNLREFVDESTAWREIIQRRLLQYTFVGDFFMVPDDPMGRKGPRLETFLQDEPHVRGVPSHLGLASGGLPPPGTPRFPTQPNGSEQSATSSLSSRLPAFSVFPPPPLPNTAVPPLPRSAAETIHLKEALKKIFPTSEQRAKIEEILAQHPHMRDMNALSAMVLDLG